MSELPTVAERINTLFRVWHVRDKPERSNKTVAEAMSRRGEATSESELAAARSGTLDLGSDRLVVLAGVFDMPELYLTGDAREIHKQLLFLEAVVHSEVSRIYLRGDECEIDLSNLITVLNYRKCDTQAHR